MTEETECEPYLLEVGTTLDFRVWTDATGLGGMDAAASATPHGDGVENLLKYAFGIDGTSPHQGSATGQPGQLPHFTVKIIGEKKVLTVEYARRVGSSLVYIAKRSENLEEGSFVPMAEEEILGPNVGRWRPWNMGSDCKFHIPASSRYLSRHGPLPPRRSGVDRDLGI